MKVSPSESSIRIKHYAVYGLFIILFSIVSFEFLSRLLFRGLVETVMSEERNLTYGFDSVLGWLPEKNSRNILHISQEITVQHNSRGFRDKEHSPLKATPRILFLGDSFVWGYDVAQEERFTEKLQRKLPGMEVVNLGVSGYGTDQEWLLLQEEYGYYQPDIVCLMVSSNDRRDNSSNSAYGYCKPYFLKENGKLSLRGVPVPKSRLYMLRSSLFLKQSLFFRICLLAYQKILIGKVTVPDPTEDIIEAMSTFSRKHDTRWVVGLIDPDDKLKEFCERKNILVLDLSSVDDRYRFPAYGNHWTEEGHSHVSDLINRFLKTKKWL